jgi:hypothetical protein
MDVVTDPREKSDLELFDPEEVRQLQEKMAQRSAQRRRLAKEKRTDRSNPNANETTER